MSTIGDDLLRDPRRTPSGRSIEAVVVYNSNPVAVAPDSRKVVPASRAKTCSPWCWSTS
jgi:hypothetical protein